MPNRYEREIEEILRNLEHTEPSPGAGQKLGERSRRKPGLSMRTRHSPSFSWNFSTAEWLLIVAIAAALIAGGYEYIVRTNIFTLVLALVSFVCLVGVALSQFLFQPRRPRSMRYGNVTITPLNRNPFSVVKAQWNLFRLKLRYRRKKEL